MERHPSKPTFHIFPYKTVENVAKQTVYMINKKLVRLEGWPVGGSYSINILACPAGSTRSIRANQSMRQCYFRRSEHARALLARAKGSTPFSHIKSWLGWAGDDDSSYKRGLRREKVNFFLCSWKLQRRARHNYQSSGVIPSPTWFLWCSWTTSKIVAKGLKRRESIFSFNDVVFGVTIINTVAS